MLSLMRKGSWWAAVGLWTALLMTVGIMVMMQPATGPPEVEDLQMAAPPEAAAPRIFDALLAPVEPPAPGWPDQYMIVGTAPTTLIGPETVLAVSVLLRIYKNGVPQYQLVEYRLTGGAVLFLPPARMATRSY